MNTTNNNTRSLLILPEGEEMFYESEGPMSPISSYYESVQRIFGDDYDEDVDGIIASFNNVYMQSVGERQHEEIQEQLESGEINVEEELFFYKDLLNNTDFYGNFNDESLREYGLFDELSPRQYTTFDFECEREHIVNEQLLREIRQAVAEREYRIFITKFRFLNEIENFDKSTLLSIHSVQTEYFTSKLRTLFMNNVFNKYITYDDDFLPKLLEDVILFVKMSTENVEGMNRFQIVYRAVIIFIKSRFGMSMFKIMKTKIMPFIKNIFDDFSVQTDIFSSSRDFLNSYKNISDSPIVMKIYKCCLYLLSLSIFDKIGLNFETFGYTKLQEATLKKKFYKKTDFIYVLCDTILFILERGYQVYITGDVNCLFHSGGTYVKIFDKCREIQRRSLLLQNPEANGFTESEFRSDLDNVIEKLQNIDKHSFRLDKEDVKSVKLLLNSMLMLRDDINTKSAARMNRKAPFGILVFGDSGIGKTTITSILCAFYAKYKHLPTGAEFRYTVNPAAKYWDGFLTSQHTVILDDIACEDPSLNDPKSLNVIIQLMNNQAFCPDQASLELKGTTPVRCQLVVATTNVKNLNAYHHWATPSAVQRRMPYIITPRVREEFKDERGMLNSSMVPEDQPYPDLWLFDIDRVDPVPIANGKRYAKMTNVAKDLGLKELLIWYKTAIDKFDKDQDRVQKCTQDMINVDLCLCCNLPDSLCSNAPQTLMEGFGYLALLYMIFILFIKFIRTLNYRIMNRSDMQLALLAYRYYTNFNRNYVKFCIEWNELKIKTMDSDYWIKLGDKMKVRMHQPKYFLVIGSAISSLLVAYKLYSKLSPQGDVSEEIGQTPVAELNGRENVWYNNAIDLTSANFTRESSSSKSMEFTDFCKKISDNVARFQCKYESGITNRGRLLALGGHIYISNNHNFLNIDSEAKLSVTFSSKIGVNSNVNLTLTEADIYRIPEHDLAFITLRELPPKKNIVKFMQIGEANGVFNGCYVGKTNEGETTYNTVKNISLGKEKSFKFPTYGIDSKHSVWSGKSEKATVEGECGMPLIINSSYGYTIVGIHFLASTFQPNVIHATNLNGDFVRQVYSKLSGFNISSGDFTLISAKDNERKITELHKKSVFRYINDGSVHIYGSFTDFRGKSKSSVMLTPMGEYLTSEGYKIKFTKPELKSWVPWHIAAKDLVKPIDTIRTDILSACVTSYIKDVTDHIKLEDVKDMMMVLDNFTTINGAQVAYIDKINRNTSAGNPWKKSKRYFMDACPPKNGMLDPVTVNDEIMDRVDDIILTYKTGRQAHPNFCAHLKDEPVSFKKATIGKTRVFTGATFDWTIVVRKYLLSFTRLLQNNRLAFEAGPGTIAQSLEWQELYDYIVKHGEDRIVAGDYVAFDKKMTPKEILAAFDVIIHFCELSGNYTEEDIQIIRCIAEDTAFAVVDYNGDLIQLFGSNPSGNPLTVILNGIVNCLRMRYVYYLLNPNKEVNSFGSNVNLMTYGDDNIMSVAKGCDWFNHTNISNKFKDLDIGYTMAEKEAESVPFIHINESSFLKRKWRFDTDLGCMLAPLDHDSIEKMLMVWNRSKAVTEEAQGIDVISTALREYFFYGKEVYLNKLKMFKKLIHDLNWEDWVTESTLPNYEELKAGFIKSSRHCKNFKDYFAIEDGE